MSPYRLLELFVRSLVRRLAWVLVAFLFAGLVSHARAAVWGGTTTAIFQQAGTTYTAVTSTAPAATGAWEVLGASVSRSVPTVVDLGAGRSTTLVARATLDTATLGTRAVEAARAAARAGRMASGLGLVMAAGEIANLVAEQSCVRLKGGSWNEDPEAPLWEKCKRSNQQVYAVEVWDVIGKPGVYVSSAEAGCSGTAGWVLSGFQPDPSGDTKLCEWTETHATVPISKRWKCPNGGPLSHQGGLCDSSVITGYEPASDSVASAGLNTDFQTFAGGGASGNWAPSEAALANGINAAGGSVDILPLAASTTTPTVDGPSSSTTFTTADGTQERTDTVTRFQTWCERLGPGTCEVETRTQQTRTNLQTGQVTQSSSSTSSGTPTTTTSSGGTTKVEVKDPCETDPQRIGCAHFGEPGTDKVPWTDKRIDFTPADVGPSGSCPPDDPGYHWQVLGVSTGWSYKPLCDAAVLIKPGVIAFAALGCLVWVFLALRS